MGERYAPHRTRLQATDTSFSLFEIAGQVRSEISTTPPLISIVFHGTIRRGTLTRCRRRPRVQDLVARDSDVATVGYHPRKGTGIADRLSDLKAPTVECD